MSLVLARYQRLADVGREWWRARVECEHLEEVLPAPTVIARSAARERYAVAGVRLADAIVELEDVPSLEAATKLSRLEGEIVLAAIGWFHAREQDAGPEAELERSEQLERRVGALVDGLAHVRRAA